MTYNDTLMTHKEIANKWGISIKTFYRWRKRGHIPDILMTHDIEGVADFLQGGGNIKQYNWDKKENDTQATDNDTPLTHEEDTDDTQQDRVGEGSEENKKYIDFLQGQLKTKDKQIDTLHERIREQNVILRDSQLLLKAAQKEKEENTKQQSTESNEPVQQTEQGSTAPQEVKQGRGQWTTILISIAVILLIAIIFIALWFVSQQ